MTILLTIAGILKRIPFIVYVALAVLLLIGYLYLNNQSLSRHLKASDTKLADATELVDTIKINETKRSKIIDNISIVVKKQTVKPENNPLSDAKIIEMAKTKGVSVTSNYINTNLNATLSCIEKITRDDTCE